MQGEADSHVHSRWSGHGSRGSGLSMHVWRRDVALAVAVKDNIGMHSPLKSRPRHAWLVERSFLSFPRVSCRVTALMAALLGTACCATVRGAEPSEAVIERRFDQVLHPFVKKYCAKCHGADRQEGKLDLSGFSSVASVRQSPGTWETVAERLDAGEMPPEEAKEQPSPEERRAALEWIRAFQNHEADRHAGDPGPVLARRLNSAEYDYSIRDLTGVDIRPT